MLLRPAFQAGFRRQFIGRGATSKLLMLHAVEALREMRGSRAKIGQREWRPYAWRREGRI